MEDLPIGRRVAYWRRRRGMSQQVFADRLGRSKSWVDKVERGVRRLDRFSVLDQLSEVLRVDPELLVGTPARRDRRPGARAAGPAEIEEIRTALERCDRMGMLPDPTEPPPDAVEVGKAVRHAWLTYQAARGATLARALPDLLRLAQAADLAHAGGAAHGAHLLGQVYQIASSALRNAGEYELAWLAADRAVSVAQRSGDELLAGGASFRVGMALLALGRARSALEIHVSVANQLAPAGSRQATPQRLSVYGMLLLQGAMAAARLGDETTVRELLALAAEAAGRLGGDHNHYWSCFGPTNVQLHRAAAAVELGDARTAVVTHERIRRHVSALVRERRVHHLLDVARGCVQLGDVQRAGALLVEGERLAPAELSSRPAARQVVGDVIRRTRGEPPPALRGLAASVGVAV